MADVRVQMSRSDAAWRDIFDQWARNDGASRAADVEREMKSNAPVDTGAYLASINTRKVQHRDRPVFQIGPDVEYGMVVEADTGNVSRAADAAR